MISVIMFNSMCRMDLGPFSSGGSAGALSLLFHPTQRGTLFANVWGAGVFRSEDDGLSKQTAPLAAASPALI